MCIARVILYELYEKLFCRFGSARFVGINFVKASARARVAPECACPCV